MSSPAVTVSPETVTTMLRGVIDPELGSDVVELGMVRGVDVAPSPEGEGVTVTVTIALTTSGCPLRAQIQKDVRTRILSMEGVDAVKLAWDEMNQEEKARAME